MFDDQQQLLDYLNSDVGQELMNRVSSMGIKTVGSWTLSLIHIYITKLMEGAASGREQALNAPFEENDAMQYATIRHIMYQKGKSVELLANYEPSLHYVAEWWKQLYGESQGKDHKGLMPTSVDLTTDLHSMGQFIQDGTRILFEMCIRDSSSETAWRRLSVVSSSSSRTMEKP